MTRVWYRGFLNPSIVLLREITVNPPMSPSACLPSLGYLTHPCLLIFRCFFANLPPFEVARGPVWLNQALGREVR